MIPDEVVKVWNDIVTSENKYKDKYFKGELTEYEDGFLQGLIYTRKLIEKQYRENGEHFY